MIREDEVYKIGRLGKPHGVQGEVTFMFDDDVFDRVDADYLVLDVNGIMVPFFIEDYRFKGSETALIKFCDINTQDEARELSSCDVYFMRSLSDDDTENVSIPEIIGYNLIDSNTGISAGKIVSVDSSTINILFELRSADGREVLIPASEELITSVDKDKKEIQINLPDGILDL